MPNIADHFDMPDAEQPGDKAELVANRLRQETGGMPVCSYPFSDGRDGAPPFGVSSDRNRQLIYVLQELEGCRQQLTGLGYPSIAAIVNEAVMATMAAWYETRPGT